METLYRWSKHVEEDRLDEWETRLIAAEVIYVAEKLVKRKRWQLSSYTTTLARADELRARYGGSVIEVLPGDWQPAAEAEAGVLLKIRDSLVVTEGGDDEVWASLREKFPDRIVLSFPPQLAFGTGGHPTTAGCLRFLADAAKKRGAGPWSVLDLGCGSGILSVAAAKLGASKVVAIEDDGLALKYARVNAERHGVRDRIEFVEADALEWIAQGGTGAFDVIVANLFSELLIRLLPDLPGSLAEGGEIVLSGFLVSQTRAVTARAESAGIPLRSFLRRGKWVAARGARANP
ncbi:MAG: 50S ribosomal protein L11 methyltransferase [Verrucomicrobiales bacterium]